MFKNAYQSGLLTIFHSVGSGPLAIWDSVTENGHIKRITDEEVHSLVLEIVGTNVATTYITCPKITKDKKTKVLGIKLPFLVMIVKNLKRYFSFEITILDDKDMRRRFRVSNFQSTTKIKPFCTSMPIGLSAGWNQIQFNLADFTRRAYGSQYLETQRVQVHANARLRRIYFTDRLYTEEELPQDYKLYLPVQRKGKKKGDKSKPDSPTEEVGVRAVDCKCVATETIAEPKKETEEKTEESNRPEEEKSLEVKATGEEVPKKRSSASVVEVIEEGAGEAIEVADEEGVAGEEIQPEDETVAEGAGEEEAWTEKGEAEAVPEEAEEAEVKEENIKEEAASEAATTEQASEAADEAETKEEQTAE